MEYEYFTTFLKLSTLGGGGASSTLTGEVLGSAIESVVAERLADGWVHDGPICRDGLTAKIPFRRPGSGELGRRQISALAHLLLGHIHDRAGAPR